MAHLARKFDEQRDPAFLRLIPSDIAILDLVKQANHPVLADLDRDQLTDGPVFFSLCAGSSRGGDAGFGAVAFNHKAFCPVAIDSVEKVLQLSVEL